MHAANCDVWVHQWRTVSTVAASCSPSYSLWYQQRPTTVRDGHDGTATVPASGDDPVPQRGAGRRTSHVRCRTSATTPPDSLYPAWTTATPHCSVSAQSPPPLRGRRGRTASTRIRWERATKRVRWGTLRTTDNDQKLSTTHRHRRRTRRKPASPSTRSLSILGCRCSRRREIEAISLVLVPLHCTSYGRDELLWIRHGSRPFSILPLCPGSQNKYWSILIFWDTGDLLLPLG